MYFPQCVFPVVINERPPYISYFPYIIEIYGYYSYIGGRDKETFKFYFYHFDLQLFQLDPNHVRNYLKASNRKLNPKDCGNKPDPIGNNQPMTTIFHKDFYGT